MADTELVFTQLTVDSLVKELKTFRKDMTVKFVALLNKSLDPIRSSIESIGTTLATQAAIIREMETGLSEHSDRIIQLEHDVKPLQSNLTRIEMFNMALKANGEDPRSRSKSQNICMVGLPEGIEGTHAREFITNLFSELLGDSILESPLAGPHP